MKGKTCCVTGHRDIPVERLRYVEERLREEVERAVEDGYSAFISGFARGADLMFARIVAERRRCSGICLEAAIPCRDRLRALMGSPRTRELLEQCSSVAVVSEEYGPGVFRLRNRYMVERSGRAIAVYDGRRGGGTAQTIRMAEEAGIEVRIIPLQTT